MYYMKSLANFLFCLILISTSALQAATWSPPIDVSAAGQDAYFPQVVIDASGNAVAVWTRSNGTNFIIQAATLPYGSSTWTPTADLSAAGQDAAFPQVGVDAAGNAVAIWSRSNGTNTIIQGAKLPFGTSAWTPTTDLSAAGQDADKPQIAVDAAGNAVAVWSRSDGSNSIVQGATLLFGSAIWVATTDLSASGQDADSVQVAVDASGNAVAVWRRFDGSNTIIQAATLAFGSTVWVAATADLSAAGNDSRDPQVAVDPAGNAVAVWSFFNGFTTDISIQGATLAFGSSTWVATSDLLAPTLNSAGSPQVGVDAAGNALAIWVRNNGVDPVLEGATLAFGSSIWVPTTTIVIPGFGEFFPILAVNASGDAVAVWVLIDAGIVTFAIQASTLAFGTGTWTAPVNIGVPAVFPLEPPVGFPDVAIGPSGNAVAIWQGTNGANAIIQAAIYGLSIPAAPTHLTGKQVNDRFATQSVLVNVLKWQAPQGGTQLVAYAIYRDSALTQLAGTVSASGKLQFQDGNRQPGQTYTYYVVAVGTGGSQSPAAVVTVYPLH